MSSFKDQYYKIEDFLTLVRNKQERSEDYDPDFVYAVYSEQDIFEPGITVYIGAPADIDGDYDDIFPDVVYENGLLYMCSDEDIQDVVDLALRQQPAVTDEQLIIALNHYLENDDFLDL
ncbi:hypothetical protein ELOC111193_12725 [Elizabethkingia occulta]|uniref:DUF7716 domain-containing protein n=1 Tax=Elizabethkingia occulta TaxID=1867263 RepID=A0A1T3MVC2_9FLAO|nr:hypothetical protein [Elizabethkingia occulta]OPC68230.1 hypothetical protein BAZ10_13710 [Elizabethkingia occulta]